MTHWYKNMTEFFKQNRDDLEYLIYVGVPVGILMILLNKCQDFSNLF